MHETLVRIASIYGLEPSVCAKREVEIPNVDREDLARLFCQLGFRRIVEIGVERAKYTEVLCRENPEAQVFGVDGWRAYRQYRDHVRQDRLDAFFVEASERVKPYRCTLVRKWSADAAKDFEDGSLDAVYIDGNHAYPYVVADLHAWARKVRPGGLVSGHDWIYSRLPALMHVKQSVRGWCEAYEISPILIFGREAKVPGEKRDDGRSWAYVQPEPRVRKPGEKVKQ